jgi:P4 family phage/plasmid primase-like protien
MSNLLDADQYVNACSENSTHGCAVAPSSSGEPTPPPADGQPAAVEPSAIQRAAVELQAAGFAVCRVNRADKKTCDLGWPKRSAAPDSFGPEHNIGIVCGPLSAPSGHSLICIDLDHERAREAALRYLPRTGMIDGRDGSRRGHWWYLVPNESIPEHFHSTSPQGSAAALEQRGHAGPRKTYTTFIDGDRKHVIDVQGTGGQAVVPPSLHDSGVRREWEGGERGEPAVVPFPELWQKLCDFAEAIGCRPFGRRAGGKPARAPCPKREKATDAPAENVADANAAAEPDDDDDLDGENPFAVTDSAHDVAVRRAGYFLDAKPDSSLPRTGNGGDAETLTTLGQLVYGFQLARDAAIRLFMEKVNARLAPVNDVWDEAAIARKVDWLIVRGPDERFPVGKQLNDPKYSEPPSRVDDPDRLAAGFLARTRVARLKDTLFEYRDGGYAVYGTNDGEAAVWGFIRRELTADFEQRQADAQPELQRLNAATEGEEPERPAAPAAPPAPAVNAVADVKEAYRVAVAEGKAAYREAVTEWKEDVRKRRDAGRDKAKLTRSLQVVQPVTNAMASATLNALRSRARKVPDTDAGGWFDGRRDDRLIPVVNGLLDPVTRKLTPHTPDYFSPFAPLPVGYDANAADPVAFLALLNELMEGDDKRVAVLQEVFGACLDPWLHVKFFAAFVGAGDNGKSVVQTVLTAMLGARNVSGVKLDQLSSQRFAAFGMFGKLANVVGDQSYFDSGDEGRLKELTGGDRSVTFEQKGRDPFSARNTARIIIACNTTPTFGDKSNAIWNRFTPIPFRYIVPAEAKNPALLDPATWTGELPSILRWSLDGLDRLRDRRAFTQSDECDALKAEHQLRSDPVREFLSDHVEAKDGGTIPRDQMQTLYTKYAQWCADSGLIRWLDRIAFGRAIGRTFPGAKSDTDREKGKTVRVWTGVTIRPAPPASNTDASRIDTDRRTNP